MRRGQNIGLNRLATLWVMVISFAVASLFAQGTMPVRSADGGIVVEICNGTDIELRQIPAPGNGPAGGQDDPAQSTCPWAAFQAATAPLLLPALPLPLAILASDNVAIPTSHLVAPQSLGFSGYARGPPIFL